MGTSKKRARVENEDRSIQQPEATRTKIDNEKSDVTKSNVPGYLGLLPIPPVRATRKPTRSTVEKYPSHLGGIVATSILPNEYEHEPLSSDPHDDQIRLLILRRGNPGDMIYCSFQVYPLSDVDGKYEALSYYWGTEGDNCEIVILAPRKPKSKGWRKATQKLLSPLELRFHIRPRLHEALVQLRRQDSELCLWVDALCINQKDEVEKTQQVKKMAEIYSSALRVLIWLGSGKKSCEEGLEFIEEILDFKTFDAKVKDEQSPPKWAALVELMSQDWFSRRWVIQELALARDATIHYNDKHINWKDFADATAIFATRFDDIKGLFHL